MTHGLDTGFLVAAEVVDHPSHIKVREIISQLLAAGDTLALAPQVLAEFIHIVTDSRRFANALTMPVAVKLAEDWSTARDVQMVFPNENVSHQFLEWLRRHSLGRKRLLDTLLAATYRECGISSLLTTNPRDFQILGGFICIAPDPTTPG
jgi:predicted nucleic acid-binding protein